MADIKTSRKEVINELYNRGELSWILYPHQRPVYNKIREVISSEHIDANSYVLDISRQFGKSTIMFIIAVEECLRNPYRTIVYVAPLKKQVVEIVTQNTFRVIFSQAPSHVIPVLKDSELVFQNGSRIRLAGTDNRNYEGLRGGLAHLVLLDEAGFMSDLRDGVLPSVTPMTKTTGGKLIFASTPPDSLDHDYQDILRDHDESGNISTFTIHDDKSLTKKQFDTIVSACKGMDTTLFKREYECKRIVESSKQVLPELSQEVYNKILLKDCNYKSDTLLQFYHKYIVADWGGRDKTAIIFAHYNYRRGKLIIEDHLDLSGNEISSNRIAHAIIEKRDTLWNPDTHQSNVRYICDSNNIIVQNDMINNHNLNFISTTKGRLADQMVQKVRDWIYDDIIEFAPASEFALKSCMNAWWAKSKNEFGRSQTFGHYDHLSALIYLVRNVDTTTDPIPRLFNVDTNTTFVMPNIEHGKQMHSLKSIFRR